jgi:2-dehydropantoate 2-reductase
MHIAILGSGAVGGYFGALLARAGHEVAFIARGAHLEAIRASGLTLRRPLGDLTVRAAAESDPAAVGPVDLVLVAVKTYHNEAALPLLRPLLAPHTAVLTLQNGVDSADETAAIAGRRAVLGGAAYIATAVIAPGVIQQTGTYRRIVFGEVFSPAPVASARVRDVASAFVRADIEAEAVADARVPLWEKFVYLAPFAGLSGATRLPAGAIREDAALRRRLLAGFAEVERVGRAEGVALPADLLDRIVAYLDGVPPSMRASLLIDLSEGRPIEVEALQGSAVRRAARAGVDVPVMAGLYATLRSLAHPAAG